MSLDPGSKLSHRLALEIAGIDVIEERFADPWDSIRAGAESDLGGLERPREAGVHTDVDSDVRDVPRELSRFFATSDAERQEDYWVAVDPTFDVERRFAVSDQDAYDHLTNVARADETQANGARDSYVAVPSLVRASAGLCGGARSGSVGVTLGPPSSQLVDTCGTPVAESKAVGGASVRAHTHVEPLTYRPWGLASNDVRYARED